jgi:hypothetical protein
MDSSDDITADLSPLEQRRMRLRAFADRVLEAVEALPMPKTALDGERTLRAVTAADRMLIQIYSRVTPLQQQPTSPSVSRAPRSEPVSSMPASLRALLYPEVKREPEIEAPETECNAPFVYRYDDDGVDEGLEDAPEDDAEPLEPEPLSDEARAALDLEQRANEIFAQYLKAMAENPEETDEWNAGPP